MLMFYCIYINMLRKRGTMRGLLSILSLSGNELNDFNNSGARDNIYHMILKLLNITFGVKRQYVVILYAAI